MYAPFQSTVDHGSVCSGAHSLGNTKANISWQCRSKRLQQAVRGISKAYNPDMMEDYGADTPKTPARKRRKKSDAAADVVAPGALLHFCIIPLPLQPSAQLTILEGYQTQGCAWYVIFSAVLGQVCMCRHLRARPSQGQFLRCNTCEWYLDLVSLTEG